MSSSFAPPKLRDPRNDALGSEPNLVLVLLLLLGDDADLLPTNRGGVKMRGAADACQQQGVTFLSMALESFDGWHEASVKEVGRLGAALTRQLTSQGRRRKRL